MSYEVSIPTSLIYDNRLSELELRLYLIIRDNCNIDGYSEIKNPKLEKLLSITDGWIRKSLANLEKYGYIVRKHDVKKNDIYKKNIRRVIWIKEAWLRYKDSKKKQAHFASHAKPTNDKRKFIHHLRENVSGQPLTIKHANGHIESYIIKDGFLHYANDGKMLRTPDATEVNQILFSNRYAVLQDPTAMIVEKQSAEQMEMSKLMQRMAELKRVM